ncbi:hypothetical protein C4552_02345 [Candidatus Parcubacteria bacterium]|nr:MAG: hypothetical protein C4552_02345 [Candidatus Parcubacteria bacterium]
MEKLIAAIWGFTPDWWSYGDPTVRTMVLGVVTLTILMASAMIGMAVLGLIAYLRRQPTSSRLVRLELAISLGMVAGAAIIQVLPLHLGPRLALTIALLALCLTATAIYIADGTSKRRISHER